MASSIPKGLAPETYPMVRIVGSWKGAGALEYEGVKASAYLHELTVNDDDGGPYLRIEPQVWLTQEEAGAIDREEPGLSTYSRLTKDLLWTRSSGFVCTAPGTEKYDGVTVPEAMSANPAGHAITWVGLISGLRLRFAADAIASVSTAAAFEGVRIVAGLVQSDLFYAYGTAAFGREMRAYMAGRPSRDEG